MLSSSDTNFPHRPFMAEFASPGRRRRPGEAFSYVPTETLPMAITPVTANENTPAGIRNEREAPPFFSRRFPDDRFWGRDIAFFCLADRTVSKSCEKGSALAENDTWQGRGRSAIRAYHSSRGRHGFLNKVPQVEAQKTTFRFFRDHREAISSFSRRRDRMLDPPCSSVF